jgi:hypothetical protein
MQVILDYLWSNKAQLLVALLAISTPVLVALLYRDSLFRRRLERGIYFHDRDRFMMEDYEKIIARSRKEMKETQLAEAVDKKKEGFINVPNISFHFANKDEIKSFYNDYFKEPTVEQIVTEMVNELRGDVKGSLPKILEAKIGGKDINKWISTIKLPDISVAEMFRRYQRETIKNNQVTLGIELVDVDLSDLSKFDETLGEINTKYGFVIDEGKIELHRSILKKKAAENTLVRLENANGTVLIEGKFRITKTQDGFYRCIYDHPVNEYTSEEGKKITISLLLKVDSIEPNIAGNYAQSVNKSIPLRVYGKVWQPIDRKADILDLQITPLAVY